MFKKLHFLFNPEANRAPRTHAAYELSNTELKKNFNKNILKERLNFILVQPIAIGVGISTGLAQGAFSLALGVIFAETAVRAGMHYALARELKKRGLIKSIDDMNIPS